MRLTTLALLIFLLCALIPAPLAQDIEEACSSRETVYPVVKTAILDEASYQAVRVRYANPMERLDIISSKRFGPWCWLQVSDGWLIDSARALISEPRCYEADKAYIVGDMNIRASASTTSRVVAKASAGDEFAVSKSYPGETWCWLKIDLGWMAETDRVRSTEPLPVPVEGSREFVSQVEAALRWLASSAPEWYEYVISGTDKIYEVPTSSDPGWCKAFVHAFDRNVRIETCFIDWSQQMGLPARVDTLEIAVFLAHEACHIHRHEAGFVYNASTDDFEEEECTKPMTGVKVALDPYRRYGTLTVDGESAFSVVERFCSEGIEDPELYCPVIERLQGG